MATGKGEGTAAGGTGTTLAQLKAICTYMGWVSTRASSDAALIRFINETLETIVSLAPWPEYLKRDGSQALSASTDEYTLSETNIDSLGIVERSNNNIPLDEISIDVWNHQKRTLTETGAPREYASEKGLNGGVTTVKMLVYPNPTASETIYYSYKRKPTRMASDGDIADWPIAREWLLVNALEYIMAQPARRIYSLHNPEFMEKVYSALGDTRASYVPIKVREVVSKQDLRIRDGYITV